MRDSVYDHIDRAMPVLFALSFIAMLSMIINLLLRMRSKVKELDGDHYARPYPYKSAALFVTSIFLLFFLSSVLKDGARNEIQFYLDHLDPAMANIRINGHNVADPAAVLVALRAVADIPAQHSHAVNRIDIAIESRIGELMLRLGRDSKRPDEYRVFYPRYRYTENNEVYRINSAVFDKY